MIFDATIKSIQTSSNIALVRFSCDWGEFEFISLDLPAGLSVNSAVKMGFKSSDVVLLAQNAQVASKNKFKANIDKISIGEIIACVNLSAGEFEFEAILSKEVASNLKQNDEICALISETSFFISEIL